MKFHLMLSTALWAFARFSIADDTGGGADTGAADAGGAEDFLAEPVDGGEKKADPAVVENATDKKDDPAAKTDADKKAEADAGKKDGDKKDEKAPRQLVDGEGKPLVDKDGKPVLFSHIDMKVPDGMELNEPLVTSFKALAEAANMAPEVQSQLFDMFLKSVQENDEAVAKSWIEHQKTLQDTAKADKEVGGEKWDETKALARTGIKAITAAAGEHGAAFAKELTTVFKATGATNHSVVMRFLRDVGRMSGEGGKKTTSANPAPADKANAANRLYPNDPFKPKQE